MNKVITVWKDGGYKIQHPLDAQYGHCSEDPNFLVNIPVNVYEPTKLSHEELKQAARPLIDILYKHFDSHTSIIVTQNIVEVLIGEIAVFVESRD